MMFNDGTNAVNRKSNLPQKS